MTLTRREFLTAATSLVVTRGASAVAGGAPARPARKDCFFGLHFDLNLSADDTNVGRDVTDAMVSRVLDVSRPDFVEYDSKGERGYLGFPSKTGMSAPGIVNDSLAVWRRVTAARGVALYNHFSSGRDAHAISKHPEWAVIDSEGKPIVNRICLFCSYEQDLMIPEMLEAALNYDLEGTWVDTDCWNVRADYCDASRRAFLDATGIDVLPRSPSDRGWHEFQEFLRDALRQHIKRYADALHKAKPGYQLTSNLMYSTFCPEPATLPLDFLSGDVSAALALRMARFQARYMERNGLPWDLMSWTSEFHPHYVDSRPKPSVSLKQEAGVIIAQGGAYQLYYNPSRSGLIDNRAIAQAAEVGQFVRERQHWAHQSETIPEVGVIYSGMTVYNTGANPFGAWAAIEAPAVGAVDMFLALGYSVDIVPDWQAGDCIAHYPLIVVPEWMYLGGQLVETLTNYLAGGGKLLIFGAENANLFADLFSLRFNDWAQPRTYYVADETGTAEVTGIWANLDTRQLEVVAHGLRNASARDSQIPIAVRVHHGQGTAIVCPGPMDTAYTQAESPVLRSAVRSMVLPLCEPTITFDSDYPELEIALRKKGGQTIIHVVNTTGAPSGTNYYHTGEVPHTGMVHTAIRLPMAPRCVILEPNGVVIPGDYKGGVWTGYVPDLSIHSMIRIVP